MSEQHAAVALAVRFVVLADASPGLLPRLLQAFAKRDLTPDAVRAVREGEVLRAEFALHAMPAEYVRLIEGNLRQAVGVHEARAVPAADAARLAA